MRSEVMKLAASLEAAVASGSALTADEARICVEGLNMLADNERAIELAEVVGEAFGVPWYDGRAMRAARRVRLLCDADAA